MDVSDERQGAGRYKDGAIFSRERRVRGPTRAATASAALSTNIAHSGRRHCSNSSILVVRPHLSSSRHGSHRLLRNSRLSRLHLTSRTTWSPPTRSKALYDERRPLKWNPPATRPLRMQTDIHFKPDRHLHILQQGHRPRPRIYANATSRRLCSGPCLSSVAAVSRKVNAPLPTPTGRRCHPG